MTAVKFSLLLALSFRRTRFREGVKEARARLAGGLALARLRWNTPRRHPVLVGAVVILIAALLQAMACAEPGADPRPLVAVSVPPQAYFVREIAGDRVRVEVMIPPGASPATHEPTLDQLRAWSEARLYLKVGHPSFPFERAWLDRLLAENDGLRVVDAAAGVAQREDDPHIWVSPRHARAMAEAIATALVELLPEHAAALRANAGRLHAEIEAVDADVRAALAGKAGARFLVFHPAWGYLASEYGLRQWAIEEGGKEPDPWRLLELIQSARDAGIQVVFAQPHFNPESARVIADEIGARVELLDPLASDWPSSLRRASRLIADGARP